MFIKKNKTFILLLVALFQFVKLTKEFKVKIIHILYIFCLYSLLKQIITSEDYGKKK